MDTNKPIEQPIQEEVRRMLDQLVEGRRHLDDSPPEFSNYSPEAMYKVDAETLAKIGSPSLTPLVEATQDPEPAIRLEAALALGRLGQTSALDALLQALHDPDTEVRWASAQSLGALGDPRAYTAVAGLLPDDESRLRDEVAMALLKLSRPDGIEVLCKPHPALGDQAYASLVEAIVAEAGPEVENRLERIVTGAPSYPQGLCALKALAARAPARAVPYLLACLQDPNFLVFKGALYILVSADTARFEAEARRALKHPSERVRKLALETLARCCGIKAIPSIVEVLFDSHEAIHIRVSAGYDLVNLAQRQRVNVREVIEKAVADPAPRVQKAMSHVLSYLGYLETHKPYKPQRKLSVKTGPTGVEEILLEPNC